MTRNDTEEVLLMSGRSFSQTIGLVFGAVYVLVGLVGFAVTSGVGFAESEGKTLLGIFELNPLHNIVHIAIGAALLGAALASPLAARAVDATVGGTYLLVGIIGWFVSGSANILAVNGADNLLHLGSAAVLLVAGLVPASRMPVVAEPARSGSAR